MHKLALAACLALACASTALAEPLRRVRLELDDARTVAAELARAGFDVLDGSLTERGFDLIVSVEDLHRLADLGYEPELIAIGRPLKDILAEQDALPPGYSDLAGLYAQMNAAAAAHPDICQVVDITARYAAPATWENRHLYAAKVSDNVAADEDEPAVLIISNFHAREIVTPVIALHALTQFTSQYGVDPTITELVNTHEIWIAPTWNPDGYNYVYTTDNLWRKNRHVFSNGVGVDLNRNFPIGWDTTCAGDTNPASETFKGMSAASEAETQTMMAWSQDVRFRRILDYHSYGREVVRGYLCLSHPFSAWHISEASALASASGYNGANRDPSADGEHYQWQVAYMAAGANLIETATDFQPSFSAAQAEAALVWPGILWAIQRPVPLWGHVLDELTGEPVSATITLVGVAFSNGETNQSDEFGRYHAFVPPGTYTLALSAPGYEAKTVSGVVVTSAGTELDILMQPGPAIGFPNGGEQVPRNVPTNITWLNANPAWQYHVQATYNFGQTGPITDSFERAQLGPDYPTGGAAPWVTTAQFALAGIRSARAGAITHNQSSWMTRTASAGNLSFWYLMSSEAGGDYFNFYIDGNQALHVSGSSPWTQYSTTLGAGLHELRWEYTKNGAFSAGHDTVFVDYLQLVADSTPWSDVVALTPPGAGSAPWTPTTLSSNCKVRVRSYHDGGYGPWSESAAVFSVVDAPPVLVGDLNCSGSVGFDDINAFVLRLSNPEAYDAAYPACPDGNADINANGTVGFDDINPFVALLSGGP